MNMECPLSTQLQNKGFCLIPEVFTAKEIAELKSLALNLTAKMTEEEKEKHKYTGSLISLEEEEGFASLIVHDGIFSGLTKAGLRDCRYLSGYVINKPSGAPRLFWHQDWWDWSQPESYEEQALQVFAMIYLDDTNRENGCLRVIPGSHRQPHPLHRKLGTAHTMHLTRLQSLIEEQQAASQALAPVYQRHQHLLSYIDRELSASLQVAELARFCGCNAASLSRSFHRDFGITLKRYLQKKLNARACSLLADGSLSIGAVGRELGFQDEYFFAFFRKMNGQTPRQYRRRLFG